MRYILLSSTVIAASATLPFVTIPEAPQGQPVETVEVTALADPLVVPEIANRPAPEGFALDLPMPGGLGVASLLPTDAVTAFFTPDEPAEMVETAEAPATDAPALGLSDGSPVPPQVELIAALPAAEEDLDAILASLEVEPEMPASPAGSALDLVPEMVRGGGFLPFAALASFFDTDAPDAASEDPPVAAPTGDVIASADASLASRAIDAPAFVPSEALSPLPEQVGSLVVTGFTPSALTVVENAAPATVIASAPVQPQAPVVETAALPTRTPGVPVPADDRQDETAVMEVTANFLNLRAGPSSKFAVVQGLRRGAEAEVIETSKSGWTRIRVRSSGKTGWAFSRYLTEASDA